jgi:glycosyltransferase involved in cell wall biosynthesis
MFKISLVTINLNNINGLKRTFDSVYSQTCDEFEYIVIDGGSTDGSVDLINQNEEHIDYWHSEKDTGIYNAMNQGIRKATGEYILMLNSGDALYSEYIIKNILDNIVLTGQDFIYGNVLWEENGKQSVGYFPTHLTFEYFTRYALHHQVLFIKKTALERLNLYNENYKIVADWALQLDGIIKHSMSYKYWNEIISICPRDGISCKPESWPMIEQERAKHLNQFYAGFLPDYQRYHKLATELEAIKNRKVFRMLKWFGLG